MKRFLSILCVLYISSFVLAQPSGRIDWGPWGFDWVAGTLAEGLAIKDLTYEGEKVMEKASLPVMRVQYDNDACGPYADRLSETSLRAAEVDQCGSNPICQRTFTRDGREWLELGVQARLGEYRIYQVFYLSDDGIVDAHMFSKGLQCITDHNHHPYWRFDIDIGDYQNDQIFTYDAGASDSGWGAGWQLRGSEFEETKNAAQDRKWYVRDGVSGKGLWIVPGVDDGPTDAFSRFDVAGRLFRSSEDEGWRFGARGELAYGSPAENISGQDIVFWYVAHMFHAAAEGRDIWHSAGPRLIVGDAAQAGVTPPGTGGNRAPVFNNPGAQTSALGDTVDLGLSASDADGDTLSFAASGLPNGLSINSSTGRITGTTTANGSFNVTVSVSDGAASSSAQFTWTVRDGSVVLSAGFTGGSEGFSYRDNAFRGTNQGAYASGAHRPNGGASGGGLEVAVGGLDNAAVYGMSGAWRGSFALSQGGQTSLQVRYKLTQASDYESDEYSQVLIALDGALKGQNGNDYIAQIRGNGNGGSEQTTGWQTVELSLGNLAAGTHNLDLGIYNNKKTYNNEASRVWFDDVLIVKTSDGSSNGAPTLTNPGNQTATVGSAVSLQLQASTASGTLSYSASGLPAGLSVNASTGLISGTPTTANSYAVTATVSNGQASASETFNWVVGQDSGTSTRTIRYTFENSNEGFQVNPSGSDSASTGKWQRANPEASGYRTYTTQLDAAADGQYALITDGRAGSSVGSYDIDSGVTSIRSPSIDLRGASAANVSLAYYLSHFNNSSSADFLKISVVGNTTAVLLDERGAANYDNASWATANYNLSSFLGQQVYLLIEAADASNPSLVEAAVDNIVVTVEE